MLILPETGPAGAIGLAAKLTAALAQAPFMAPDGALVPIRASFGIASLPDDVGDLTGLVALADANLYVSKRDGGGTVTAGAAERTERI